MIMSDVYHNALLVQVPLGVLLQLVWSPPGGDTFFRLEVYERVGIFRAELLRRVGI